MRLQGGESLGGEGVLITDNDLRQDLLEIAAVAYQSNVRQAATSLASWDSLHWPVPCPPLFVNEDSALARSLKKAYRSLVQVEFQNDFGGRYLPAAIVPPLPGGEGLDKKISSPVLGTIYDLLFGIVWVPIRGTHFQPLGAFSVPILGTKSGSQN